MPDHLFLYGTLRPELVPPRARRLIEGLTPLGRGTIQGRLYDLGPYPGAVLDAEAGQIVGEFCRLPEDSSEALAALDRYEDYDPARPENSLYVRVPVTVALERGGTCECWVYEYRRDVSGATLVAGGDYVAWRAASRTGQGSRDQGGGSDARP